MLELDEITIRRAAKKDPRAFKQVYDHYAPFVWKVVFKGVNGRQDMAAEVMQETFLRVWNSLKSFGGASRLSTWIYRIAYNCMLTILGKIKPMHSGTDPDELPARGNQGAAEAREIVEILLKELDSRDRFLLTAHEISGFEYDELARITGDSAGTLRVRMHRLKESLQERFGHLFSDRSASS